MEKLRSLSDFALVLVASVFAAKTYIDDSGPGGTFITSYNYLNERRDKSGWYDFLADAVNCYKCLSIWTALFLVIVRAVSRPLFLSIAVPLCAGMLADLMAESSEKEHPLGFNLSNLTARR